MYIVNSVNISIDCMVYVYVYVLHTYECVVLDVRGVVCMKLRRKLCLYFETYACLCVEFTYIFWRAGTHVKIVFFGCRGLNKCRECV